MKQIVDSMKIIINCHKNRINQISTPETECTNANNIANNYQPPSNQPTNEAIKGITENAYNCNFTKFLEQYGSQIYQNIRGRRTYTQNELQQLMNFYTTNSYPTSQEFEQIARTMALPRRKIIVFFQNQRMREKHENQKEHRLLSKLSNTSNTI